MANQNLQAAKAAKKDEFYTQLPDIERELRHYKEHFKGKTVICNCDDPRVSNFYKFFSMKFEQLGLKRLICTCYKHQDVDLFGEHSSEKAVYIDYTGGEENILPLKGDGDFRSEECIELLKQADIVVTNPPFSLFREYVAQLMKYEKKFLIIGNQNAMSYNDIFNFIKANKIWTGYNSGSQSFFVPDDYEQGNIKIEDGRRLAKFGNICWFTNLDIEKLHEELILYKKYSPEDYPSYKNYDAIDVPTVSSIPVDYDGIMGISITFINSYNPDQFEIVGSINDTQWLKDAGVEPMGQETINKFRAQGNRSHITANMRAPYIEVNGIVSRPYARIFIRRKQQ